MPTQLFDGPTIEVTLARVRAELGPDARIVSADRVRTGGVGGFFAKEHVEVVVEIAETGTPIEPTIMPGAHAAPASPPRSLLDLADSVSDHEQAFSGGAGRISTESADFASVLRRIAGEADLAVAAQTAGESVVVDLPHGTAPVAVFEAEPTPEVAPEPPLATPPTAGASRALAAFTALARRSPRTPRREPRADLELEVEVVPAPPADPPMPVLPVPALTRPEPMPVAALGDPVVTAGEAVDDHRMWMPAMAPPAPVAPSLPPAAAPIATAAGMVEAIEPVDAAPVDPTPVAVAEPEIELVPDGAGTRAAGALAVVPATTRATSTSLAVPAFSGDLQRLGLPGALVPAYGEGDLFAALVAQLERLPNVPSLPRNKGAVLAIVGPARQAMEIARDVALELRTHPDDVVMFGEGVESPDGVQLGSAEDAEAQRRSWRRRLDPTVVVIDSTVSATDEWAHDVLCALEPHAVWGVVDGGRKLEDLAAWSDQVGGLDALAVTGVKGTLTPASVLHLGLPVAMLDGEPASPELWAEILMDRLAA